MRDLSKYIDSLISVNKPFHTNLTTFDVTYENGMNIITLEYDFAEDEPTYNLCRIVQKNDKIHLNDILSPLPKECYTIKTVEKNKPKPKGLDYYVENSGIDIDNQTGYSILKPIYGNDFIDIDNITPAVFVS